MLKKIESCQNAKQLKENKTYFDYFNLGDNINSADDNFQAELSGNGNSIVYMAGLKFYNAIYHSKKVNGKWTPPVNLSPQVKSDGNLFVSSLSADGTTLYMTKNDNFNSDIYVSYFNDSIWSEAEKLNDNINTTYWESHASESHDGSTLYFSSSKIEGYGGMDIYKSEKNQVTGEWSEPVNLGDVINTPFNEDCPFLTKDGKRLYFSSQGHNTIGGFDIFYSVKSDSNTWTKPVNIGYPINSTDDDIFFTPFNEGNGAFYSMFGLEDSYGKDDIYYLNIFSDRNPRKVNIKGTIIAPGIASEKDSEINVDILEKTTSTKIGSAKPEISTGKFDYTLSKPGKYQIIASAEGYADSKKDFSLPSDYSKAEIIINARLKPEKKEEIVLPVVFFDFDKYSISKKEAGKIDELFRIMKNNKDITIEIMGYTDFVGDETYNNKLGMKRSSEIVNLLVSKGIQKERLKVKTGGEANPIALNRFPDGSDSPGGRKYNRRAVPIILQSDNKLIITEKIIIPDKLKISE